MTDDLGALQSQGSKRRRERGLKEGEKSNRRRLRAAQAQPLQPGKRRQDRCIAVRSSETMAAGLVDQDEKLDEETFRRPDVGGEGLEACFMVLRELDSL